MMEMDLKKNKAKIRKDTKTTAMGGHQNVDTQEENLRNIGHGGARRKTNNNNLTISENSPESVMYSFVTDCPRDSVPTTARLSVEPCSREDFERINNSGQCYRMTRNPRGSALIINIYDYLRPTGSGTWEINEEDRRRGSEHDVGSLQELFRELYFTTEVLTDWGTQQPGLTEEQITYTVRHFAETRHEEEQCVIVALMGHGNDHDIILDSYQTPINYINLMKCFDDNPHLRGKPKVFIIQACRGGAINERYPDLLETDTSRLRHQLEHDGIKAKCADAFWMLSTPPGYVSIRNPDHGAVFIQSLTSVFRQHAKTCHIARLDQRIRQYMNDHCQNIGLAHVNQHTSTLFKDLYFCPGRYRDHGNYRLEPLPGSSNLRQRHTGASRATPGVGNSSSRGSNQSSGGTYSSSRGFNPSSRGTHSSSRGLNPSSGGTYSSSRGSFPSSGGTYSSSRGSNPSSRGTYSSSRGPNPSSRGTYSSSRGPNPSSGGSVSSSISTGTSSSPWCCRMLLEICMLAYDAYLKVIETIRRVARYMTS